MRSRPLSRRTPLRRTPLRHGRPLDPMALGDLVQYRVGRAWCPATVTRLTPSSIELRDEHTGAPVTLRTPTRRILRALHGARLIEMQSDPRCRPAPRLDVAFVPAAALVTVRTAAMLRPVPKGPPPYRSAAYLEYVHEYRCCNPLCPTPQAPIEAHHAGEHGVSQKAPDTTAVPLCVFCHLSVTTTYALPGLSRAETEALFLRVERDLVTTWHRRHEARTVTVPLLRLVAAAVALLVLWPGAAQATEAPGSATSPTRLWLFVAGIVGEMAGAFLLGLLYERLSHPRGVRSARAARSARSAAVAPAGAQFREECPSEPTRSQCGLDV